MSLLIVVLVGGRCGVRPHWVTWQRCNVVITFNGGGVRHWVTWDCCKVVVTLNGSGGVRRNDVVVRGLRGESICYDNKC